MLILGLLLVIGSAALGVGLAYDGGEAASVEILGTTVSTTAAGLFFTGAATMLVFLVGVWLLSSKMGRARRKRTERKAERREQRESVNQLERERTALAAENERLSQQLDNTTAPGDSSTGPSRTGTVTGTGTDTAPSDNGSAPSRTDTARSDTGTPSETGTERGTVDLRDQASTTPSNGKHA